jgi:hypothetical protein
MPTAIRCLTCANWLGVRLPDGRPLVLGPGGRVVIVIGRADLDQTPLAGVLHVDDLALTIDDPMPAPATLLFAHTCVAFQRAPVPAIATRIPVDGDHDHPMKTLSARSAQPSKRSAACRIGRSGVVFDSMTNPS